MRLSKIISLVDAVRVELSQCQTIPPAHEDKLEEGLRITFSFQIHPVRQENRQKNTAYKLRSTHKKAHHAYLRILTELPQIYIPFILAVSPPQCSSVDIILLLQHYKSQSQQLEAIQFDTAAENIVRDISIRHKCDHSKWYPRLLHILHPKVLPARPHSAAEDVDKFSIKGLNTAELHDYFGDQVFKVFDESPERMLEKQSQCLEKTSCAWIEFAHNGVNDSVFYLRVGNAEQLVCALFPNAVRCLPKVADGQPGDNACIPWRGASIPGIASCFSAESCAAMDTSELRIWEKEQGLSDTTDCVTMNVSRTQPSWGLIILRVGVFAAYSVSHRLCN